MYKSIISKLNKSILYNAEILYQLSESVSFIKENKFLII